MLKALGSILTLFLILGIFHTILTVIGLMGRGGALGKKALELRETIGLSLALKMYITMSITIMIALFLQIGHPNFDTTL